MHRQVLCTLFCVAALSACHPPASEHEDELSLDESDFREEAERGGAVKAASVPIQLGTSLGAELTRASQRWSFSFAISAPARVELRTLPGSGGLEVDTVLTLRVADEQKGTPRKIAENDDGADTRFSALQAELAAGSYTIEVRGYRPRTRGPFTLTTACAGTGCPALPTPCPFGEQFSDLREHPTLAIVSEVWIRHEDELPDDVERAQLVLAVQQSSHSDVRTPSEALARVDQQEVRRLELRERTGAGAFTVFEYGVGDNSYGAVFARGALPVLASIHDGDLLDCALVTSAVAASAQE
jgi:hypothetical protein